MPCAQVGLFNGERWDTTGITTPQELQCVLFVPEGVFSTDAARRMLPDKVDRNDAIFNIARVAVLTQAMCTGNLTRLKSAMQDKMHQPVRGRPDIMPAMYPCIEAALAAGAKGACLYAGSAMTLDPRPLCRDYPPPPTMGLLPWPLLGMPLSPTLRLRTLFTPGGNTTKRRHLWAPCLAGRGEEGQG